MSGLPMGI